MSRFFRDLLVAPLSIVALLACTPDASSDKRDAVAAADAPIVSANDAIIDNAALADGAVANDGSAVGANTTSQPSAERSSRRVVLNGIDLTGVGYDKGDPAAPIVMIDFSDFGCPYCGNHSRQTLPELDREFISTGKVFYKYVPLVMGSFPNGDTGAQAAECAAEEGKFWPMHDRLYEGQTEWRKNDNPTPVYQRYARELGLDATRFAACLADGRTDGRTKRASAVAQRLGIRATPTFTIDGEGIEGALPLDIFQEFLRMKLAK